MPGMDGFEAAEVIKQRERTSTIPIIFLTALSKEDQHVFRGYEVGAVDYVFKPFNPEILRAKVAVFVELWEKNRQIRDQADQLAAQELADLRRASAEQYRQLADAMPQIVWTADAEGRATYYNRRWFEYTGMTEDELDDHAWARVDASGRPAAGGRTARGDARERRHLRGRVPLQVARRDAGAGTSAARCRSATRTARSTSGSARRPTSTTASATEEAQRFLLDAGAELSRSLDWRAGLKAVARVAVPRVADWCAVHVVEEDGTISSLAIEHADPAKVIFAREVQERYPPRRDDPRGAAEVIRSGTSQLISEVPADAFTAAAQDETH